MHFSQIDLIAFVVRFIYLLATKEKTTNSNIMNANRLISLLSSKIVRRTRYVNEHTRRRRHSFQSETIAYMIYGRSYIYPGRWFLKQYSRNFRRDLDQSGHLICSPECCFHEIPGNPRILRVPWQIVRPG